MSNELKFTRADSVTEIGRLHFEGTKCTVYVRGLDSVMRVVGTYDNNMEAEQALRIALKTRINELQNELDSFIRAWESLI